MEERIKCPVCGKYEFEERDDFDICDVSNSQIGRASCRERV